VALWLAVAIGMRPPARAGAVNAAAGFALGGKQQS